MVEQDTQIWDHVQDDELAYDYHKRQYSEPYRSTVHFFDFLDSHNLLNFGGQKAIVDFGCGMGANLHYASRRYPDERFIGMDLNSGLVETGNGLLAELGSRNAHLEVADLFRDADRYHGDAGVVISMQVLLAMPDPTATLSAMAQSGPRTIALSSLFTESLVEVKCSFRDHSRPLGMNSYFPGEYNIYPLDLTRRTLADLGYTEFKQASFEIDIDLPEPDHGGIGTYTVPTSSGRRLQFSGPMHMPWYFIAASRPA